MKRQADTDYSMRKRSRRGSYSAGAGSAASARDVAMRDVPRNIRAYVRRAIDTNVEDKHLSYNLDTLFPSVSNNWTEANVCNPDQGDTVSTRVGRRIRIKSISIRGILLGGVSDLSTDDVYNTVRIVIGLYQGTSNTPLAAGGQGYDNPLIATSGTSAGQRLIKKYYDKYHAIQTCGKGLSAGYAPVPREFEFYKRFFRPIVVTYGDSTEDYPSKALIMSMQSDSMAASNPGFVCGYVMCKFEDA